MVGRFHIRHTFLFLFRKVLSYAVNIAEYSERDLSTSFFPEIFIVNESGASVYSASKIAQEEFPDLDSLDRGTISLGRRFIDPLSELVKVPV